ncbi:MAG TPA: hypothetical protein VHE30_30480 [Polyangiaceae bacterium]|nr:hypothetical protein [Polyangiaceae bacterium]
MTKKHSRIERLKAPFVVTALLAATGCGGSVNEGNGQPLEGNGGSGGSGGSSGGGAGAGGWDGTGGSQNPPPPICPATVPLAGDGCSYTGAPCTYPAAGPCQLTYTASCVNWTNGGGGVWQVSSEPGNWSCNPPPPILCPSEPPVAGTSCAGPLGPYSGSDCGYGDCYGTPTEYWNCRMVGLDSMPVWVQTGIATCNPPPPPFDAGPGIPSTGGAAGTFGDGGAPWPD